MGDGLQVTAVQDNPFLQRPISRTNGRDSQNPCSKTKLTSSVVITGSHAVRHSGNKKRMTNWPNYN